MTPIFATVTMITGSWNANPSPSISVRKNDSVSFPSGCQLKISERMATTPHNFYPVCDGSMDNIVGVVATRELWRRQLVGEPIDIHAAMETPLFIPEGTSMLSAMEQLRNLRSPMAIVMDEYGGVSGLITLNDVVADLVGDPSDTTTAEQGKIVRREDGSMLVDGDYAAHEVIELLGITELPGEAESRYETLGRFIVNQLGEIPQPGDFVEHGSYRFEVMDMDGNRIDKVLIQNIEPI